jgi:hypothetical protein
LRALLSSLSLNSFRPAGKDDAHNWMISVRRASTGSTAGAVNIRRYDFLPEWRKRWLVIRDEIEQTVSEYAAQRINIRVVNVLISAFSELGK